MKTHIYSAIILSLFVFSSAGAYAGDDAWLDKAQAEYEKAQEIEEAKQRHSRRTNPEVLYWGLMVELARIREELTLIRRGLELDRLEH